MIQRARQEATIRASAHELWSVLVDFERYTDWARDLKQVVVEERDGDGRGTVVRYRAAAMGWSTNYTLRYDHSDAPASLPWVLVRGDMMRRLDGAYRFVPSPDEPGSTVVTYELEVDLVVPLPGFVKHRAEHKIMHTALRDLKAFVERTRS